jgi:hypothetical protein
MMSNNELWDNFRIRKPSPRESGCADARLITTRIIESTAFLFLYIPLNTLRNASDPPYENKMSRITLSVSILLEAPPPSLPGQLLVQIFIIKEEEKNSGYLRKHNKVDW